MFRGSQTTAKGGELINIRIAPKPGYADGNNPGTRATVGDDGAFGWQDSE